MIYSCKTGKCWDQTFLTGTCPEMVLVTLAGLDFDSGPLTGDHALIFPKKCSKSANSNLIFHWKGRGDTALPLTYLDSPMAEFNLLIFLFFSILGIFRGKNGVKVGPNIKTLGVARFCKNSNFFKILETLFVSP